VQKKCNDWWHSVKTTFGKDKAGLENAVNAQVQQLGKEASLKSAANRFFFAKVRETSFYQSSLFEQCCLRKVLGYEGRVEICSPI